MITFLRKSGTDNESCEILQSFRKYQPLYLRVKHWFACFSFFKMFSKLIDRTCYFLFWWCIVSKNLIM